MKKIYLLILCAINLLVFCTISKRIFASVDIQNVKKTMIAEVGSIKPKDLEYEGYQIVSSNINFNRSGDYQVVYRNEETNNRRDESIDGELRAWLEGKEKTLTSLEKEEKKISEAEQLIDMQKDGQNKGE